MWWCSLLPNVCIGWSQVPQISELICFGRQGMRFKLDMVGFVAILASDSAPWLSLASWVGQAPRRASTPTLLLANWGLYNVGFFIRVMCKGLSSCIFWLDDTSGLRIGKGFCGCTSHYHKKSFSKSHLSAHQPKSRSFLFYVHPLGWELGDDALVGVEVYCEWAWLFRYQIVDPPNQVYIKEHFF